MQTRAIAGYLSTELTYAWNDIINRRMLQIRYLILYLLSLSALLTYALFGFEHLIGVDTISKSKYGSIGLVLVLLCIMGNWAYTIFLGYNFRGIIISKKNIAALRMYCTDKLKDQGRDTLEFCDYNKPSEVFVGIGYGNAPYWFVLINFGVGASSVYFIDYLASTIMAFEIFFVASSFLMAFYPTVCGHFHRYLYIAKKVMPNCSESLAREQIRQEKRNKKDKSGIRVLRIAYWLVVAVVSILFVFRMGICSRDELCGLTWFIGCGWLFLLFLRLFMLRWELTLKPVPIVHRLYR